MVSLYKYREPTVKADVSANMTFNKELNGKMYELKLNAKGKLSAPVLYYERETRYDPEDWEINFDKAEYEVTDTDWSYPESLVSEFKDDEEMENFLYSLEEEYITDIENEFSQNVEAECLN